MGLLFAYILKSALYVIAFYLFYRLLLSRDTFYRFNRHALLIMLMMSIVLSLIEFSHEVAAGAGQITVDFSASALAIVDDAEGNIPWLAWGMLIYLIGIGLFSLRMILSYLSLAKVLHSGKRRKLSEYGIAGNEDICLLVHHNGMSPFSWMNYIVVNEEDLQTNGRSIVYHELGHIRHHHTLDLLFTELCLIFQWFNPAIWLMRRELQTIHEYQADEEVLAEGIDARQYQLLLIEKATGTRLQSITCSLHQSSIKKRITMMLKKKSNPWAKAKMLFAIPVAIAGIALLSTPAASAITTEISGCKVSEIFADGQTFAPESAAPAPKSAETPEDNAGEQVFMVCEQMPTFPGGEQALMKYLSETLKYPAEAADKGVQGRVIVSFVVEKDGSIGNISVQRPADPALDAEAMRVVSNMPKWTPGKQRGQAVRVQYMLPINFDMGK